MSGTGTTHSSFEIKFRRDLKASLSRSSVPELSAIPFLLTAVRPAQLLEPEGGTWQYLTFPDDTP